MDIKLELVVHTVKGIEQKLDYHEGVTREVLKKTAELHHSPRMSLPCTGCHGQ